MKRVYWVLVFLLVGGFMAEALTNDFALPVQTQAAGGWTEMDVDLVWAFSSADAPSFVISVNDDLTGDVSVGWRIRAKQDAGVYVYGIVNKIELSGGITLFTIDGGTDYSFADESITSVAFSPVKAPLGFSVDPSKWSIAMEDATDRTSATFGSVVQLDSSHYIDLPIGAYYVDYQAYVNWTGVTTNMNVNLALSTSTSSISSKSYQRGIQTVASGATTPVALNVEMNPKLIVVTSKTRYYLVGVFVATGTDWGFSGSTYAPTIIRAVSAYL